MQSPSGPTRCQLSLFVPRTQSAVLEQVRRLLDPVQADLIPAHVTLIREDELMDMSVTDIAQRFAEVESRAVSLCFGPVECFDGHGVQLACVDGQEQFHALRRQWLGERILRKPVPHITLAHPRNRAFAGDALAAANFGDGVTITFDTAYLIEQAAGTPWRILQEFRLG